jgi:hypothetical protein
MTGNGGAARRAPGGRGTWQWRSSVAGARLGVEEAAKSVSSVRGDVARQWGWRCRGALVENIGGRSVNGVLKAKAWHGARREEPWLDLARRQRRRTVWGGACGAAAHARAARPDRGGKAAEGGPRHSEGTRG